MTQLTLRQYSRELSETMYISRGGFTTRTHNFIVFYDNKKEYISEVIGDRVLIKNCMMQLFEYLKTFPSLSVGELLTYVHKWERSFVYLEHCSSIRAITNAFDWLYLTYLSHMKGDSIFEILKLEAPTRNHTRVYGSNIYWKETKDAFQKQIDNFPFDKTRIVKAHLGRKCFKDEFEYYNVLAENKKITHFMIDYNCGYTMDEFRSLCSCLSTNKEIMSKLLWLEEPTHPDHSTEWSQCLPEVDMAAGENHHGLIQQQNLINNGVRWIMPDLGRTLSIFDFPKLLKYCLNTNSNISFHSYSSGFLAYISLLLSMSMPVDRTYYEHDFSSNAFLDKVIKDAITISDGEAIIDSSLLHDLKLEEDSTWAIKIYSY